MANLGLFRRSRLLWGGVACIVLYTMIRTLRCGSSTDARGLRSMGTSPANQQNSATCDPTSTDCATGCPVCTLETYGGDPKNDGYGAWTLCGNMVERSGLVVASFGVGHDISFDAALIHKRDAIVYAFDPVTSVEEVKAMMAAADITEAQYRFLQWGLSNRDTTATFMRSTDPRIRSQSLFDGQTYVDKGVTCPIRTLSSIMRHVGVEYWDVLKMDIEGAEFDVFLADPAMVLNIPADQVLIEFHERLAQNVDQFVLKRQAITALLALHGFREVKQPKASNSVDVIFARTCPRRG